MSRGSFKKTRITVPQINWILTSSEDPFLTVQAEKESEIHAKEWNSVNVEIKFKCEICVTK